MKNIAVPSLFLATVHTLDMTNLKVTGEDFNPVATGLPALDAVSQEHGVHSN